MKYLITYENHIPKLDKYVIWNSSDELYIFKIISEEKLTDFFKIKYQIMYFIKKGTSNIEKTKLIRSEIITKNKDNIIYQSDNIEDCLNILPYILKTQKYNI